MIKLAFVISILVICSCKNGKKRTGDMPADNSPVSATNNTGYHLLETKACNYQNVSAQFELAALFRRYTDTILHNDSCILNVYIQDKQAKATVDSFSLTSLYYFRNIFASCDNISSYSTGYNKERPVVDNYYGDIVIADLNFDTKDDIAIVFDMGGNGGPLYSYYIQNDQNRFSLDSFLTDSVIYFPEIIDSKKQQLTNYVRSGACCMGETVYQYDKASRKWKQVRYKLFGNK